jgi:hypothetical protein
VSIENLQRLHATKDSFTFHGAGDNKIILEREVINTILQWIDKDYDDGVSLSICAGDQDISIIVLGKMFELTQDELSIRMDRSIFHMVLRKMFQMKKDEFEVDNNMIFKIMQDCKGCVQSRMHP